MIHLQTADARVSFTVRAPVSLPNIGSGVVIDGIEYVVVAHRGNVAIIERAAKQ